MDSSRFNLSRSESIHYRDIGTQTDEQKESLGDAVIEIKNSGNDGVEDLNLSAKRMMKSGIAGALTGGGLMLSGFVYSKFSTDSEAVSSSLFGSGSVAVVGGVVTLARGAYRFVTNSVMPDSAVNALNEASSKIQENIVNK